MSIFDTEMGLNLPDEYKNVPAIFFDLLKIHRNNKPEIEKEQDGKQNH